MTGKVLFAFWLLVAVSASGQTSGDLAVKDLAVSGHEIHPGVLMTAEYAEDGQVCEMTVEKRHTTETKIDLSSSIPAELVQSTCR
jgi:hypothetical protein